MPPAYAPQVEVTTTIGTFSIELYAQHAPKACQNFMELAKRSYYDGTLVSVVAAACTLGRSRRGLTSLCLQFHRIVQGFMVQGGDPTGTGRGGESCWGGKFAVRLLGTR